MQWVYSTPNEIKMNKESLISSQNHNLTQFHLLMSVLNGCKARFLSEKLRMQIETRIKPLISYDWAIQDAPRSKSIVTISYSFLSFFFSGIAGSLYQTSSLVFQLVLFTDFFSYFRLNYGTNWTDRECPCLIKRTRKGIFYELQFASIIWFKWSFTSKAKVRLITKKVNTFF